MMLRRMLVGSAVALAIMAGCEQLSTPNESTLTGEEIAALKEMILSDPLYTNDAAMLDDGDAPSVNGSLAKTTTPIIPLHWGLRIFSVEREIAFEHVDDTTVIATLTHRLEGTVYIVAKYSTEDTTRTLIQKPFSAQTERKIKFYKVGDSDDENSRDRDRHGWKPAEVSASKGGTENSQVTITRLEVTAGDQTIVITEPLEYFFELPRNDRHRTRPLIFSLGVRQELTARVTVVSADPDTDWVSVHRPYVLMMAHRPDLVKPRHERMQLISETQTASGYERVYEASWETVVPGRHSFFISAVTRSSLFDDEAPFSAQLWGVPYITQ